MEESWVLKSATMVIRSKAMVVVTSVSKTIFISVLPLAGLASYVAVTESSKVPKGVTTPTPNLETAVTPNASSREVGLVREVNLA